MFRRCRSSGMYRPLTTKEMIDSCIPDFAAISLWVQPFSRIASLSGLTLFLIFTLLLLNCCTLQQ
jgi:hypothetical protein